MEGYIFVAIRQGLVYCGRQGAVAKAQLGASLHPAAGAGQAFPGVTVGLAEQQNLAHGAGGHFNTHQAGRQNLRIVDDQHISGVQVFRQVMEDAVFNRIILAVKHHQAGTVTRVSGLLGNQFFGQVIPKIFL